MAELDSMVSVIDAKAGVNAEVTSSTHQDTNAGLARGERAPQTTLARNGTGMSLWIFALESSPVITFESVGIL